METKEYTINFIQASQYKKAHQTSARYDKGISEFEKVGFTPVYISGFSAPFVEEAVVKVAMKLEETIPVTINDTILIIGSIMMAYTNDGLVGEDGFVNLSASEVLISQGLDAYFTSRELGRLPYAKP